VIKRKYYIDKKCKKMGGSKNVKEPNEIKKDFYNISNKVQKVVVQKLKGLKTLN
jgi:hypothetical protein